MYRCFELAQMGKSSAHPNPMVGAVVVHQEKIIGEGYHTKFGNPHAEVEAIRSVNDKSLLALSTLYVNLEPCCHTGKTPPCTSLILSHKIPKVVICNTDPNEKVAGKGIQLLQENGVEVVVDIAREQGEFLNRKFFHFHRNKKPYLLLKWAKTADNFMGRLPKDSDLSSKISNPVSDVFVHQLRAEADAILIGANTAVVDNPKLTTRLVPGRNPIRLVIDLNGNIPSQHHLFTDGLPTVVFGAKQENVNATFIEAGKKDEVWNVINNYAFTQNMLSILVEGGRETLQYLIDNNLWNEAIVIESKQTWKVGVASPIIENSPSEVVSVDSDTVYTYHNA